MADMLLYLSADGTSSGAQVEIECQDALTLQTGQGLNVKKYKNCTHSTHSEAGFQASSTFGPEAPLGAGQALLWDASTTKARQYFWAKDGDTGGLIFEGVCKVAITDISSPTNDEKTHSFTIGSDGPVTRSATA